MGLTLLDPQTGPSSSPCSRCSSAATTLKGSVWPMLAPPNTSSPPKSEAALVNLPRLTTRAITGANGPCCSHAGLAQPAAPSWSNPEGGAPVVVLRCRSATGCDTSARQWLPTRRLLLLLLQSAPLLVPASPPPLLAALLVCCCALLHPASCACCSRQRCTAGCGGASMSTFSTPTLKVRQPRSSTSVRKPAGHRTRNGWKVGNAATHHIRLGASQHRHKGHGLDYRRHGLPSRSAYAVDCTILYVCAALSITPFSHPPTTLPPPFSHLPPSLHHDPLSPLPTPHPCAAGAGRQGR